MAAGLFRRWWKPSAKAQETGTAPTLSSPDSGGGDTLPYPSLKGGETRAASAGGIRAELDEARAARRQLQQDLDALLKSKREADQAAAESGQKVTGLLAEVQRLTEHARTLESELAASRVSFVQHAARVQELESLIPQHATLRAAYEAIDRERQSLSRRVADMTHSREALQAERDRLAGEVAIAHATIASRDTQIAALRGDEDHWKQMVSQLTQEVANQKAGLAGLQSQVARLSALEAEHARLRIEYLSLIHI